MRQASRPARSAGRASLRRARRENASPRADARCLGSGVLGMVATRHLPNLITVLRVFLVIPAAWLLWRDQVAEALLLIAVAGISDAIDGALARRFDWRTRFGAIVDPAADKLLIVVVCAVLAIQGHLPVWLLVVVVGRDIVIVSGALTYRRLFGDLEIAPTPLSKFNTGLQIGAVLLLLVARVDIEPVAAVSAAVVDPWALLAVAVVSVLSGGQYVIVWSRRAKLASRAQRARNAAGGRTESPA